MPEASETNPFILFRPSAGKEYRKRFVRLVLLAFTGMLSIAVKGASQSVAVSACVALLGQELCSFNCNFGPRLFCPCHPTLIPRSGWAGVTFTSVIWYAANHDSVKEERT